MGQESRMNRREERGCSWGTNFHKEDIPLSISAHANSSSQLWYLHLPLQRDYAFTSCGAKGLRREIAGKWDTCDILYKHDYTRPWLPSFPQHCRGIIFSLSTPVLSKLEGFCRLLGLKWTLESGSQALPTQAKCKREMKQLTIKLRPNL